MRIVTPCLLATIALSAVVLAAAPAAAAGPDCKNPMTQMAMNICAYRDFKTADAKLNKTYRALMHKLKDDRVAQKKLRIAERAWIAFRNAQCDFEGHGVEGGSMQPLIIDSCMSQLTGQHTKELAHQPSYDLGAPP